MARAQITSDNVTPLIEIITWFCLIISILCFLARGATKSVLVHQFNLDDILLILSIVKLYIPRYSPSKLPSNCGQFFLVGQSASVTVATANGYGQYAAALTASQLERSLKVGLSLLWFVRIPTNPVPRLNTLLGFCTFSA